MLTAGKIRSQRRQGWQGHSTRSALEQGSEDASSSLERLPELIELPELPREILRRLDIYLDPTGRTFH
jgi:hypothetical protein